MTFLRRWLAATLEDKFVVLLVLGWLLLGSYEIATILYDHRLPDQWPTITDISTTWAAFRIALVIAISFTWAWLVMHLYRWARR